MIGENDARREVLKINITDAIVRQRVIIEGTEGRKNDTELIVCINDRSIITTER